MADQMKQQLQRLRAAIAHAERAHDLAGKRLAESERAHRAHAAASCPDSCARELHEAGEEHSTAAQRLLDARLELENHEAEDRDRDPDPIEPQTDYTFREIVAKLYQKRQRATYGAVGELRRASALTVREWIKAPDTDNSFVVSARTGEPSGYPPDAVHPQLKKHGHILRTGAELLEWLQKNR